MSAAADRVEMRSAATGTEVRLDFYRGDGEWAA
jgi:hypothetical protein